MFIASHGKNWVKEVNYMVLWGECYELVWSELWERQDNNAAVFVDVMKASRWVVYVR